jgi:FMN phosphatase YigB (HAD superfamily)
MSGPWIPHDVEFFADIDRPDFAVALWAGHRWFGYDLVRWARPERVVELGTHYGCSFFAFCQAALADRSDCELVAVDTWEGDGHTIYDEDVHQVFTTILERRFATLNTRVLRSTFDDAIDQVADDSVDLLHIDGLHTYEAVRHDYETWLPKLAPNGIVLFHDVAPSSGLGSARYWLEIRDSGPGFAFLHSLGLGVLLPKGIEGRQELLELGESSWLPYYQHRAGHDLARRQVIDTTRMIDDRDEALAATTALVDERDRLIDQVAEELTGTRQLLRENRQALDEVRADQELIESERLAATTEARRLRDQLKAQAETTGQRTAEVEAAERDRADLVAENERLHHHIAGLTEERDALAANLDLYRRTLRPVRWAARPARGLVRRVRHRQPLSPPPAERDEAMVVDPADGDATPALFDRDWYLARYPDIGRAGVDPAAHWMTYGWKEGRQPCPLFDAGAYLRSNPDVASTEIEPLTHWTGWGWREDRDPSELFSTSFYRSRNGDLVGDDDPLDHYLAQGVARGLFVSLDHERSVLEDRPRAATTDAILDDVVVHVDGTERSVPYAMVADLDADLFTFDLWDTLLTRTRPADAAKLATARRIRVALGLGPEDQPSTWDLMGQRVEIEAEIAGPDNGEYLLDDVLTRQLERLVDPGRDDVGGLVTALRRAELEDEMRSTVPIDDTVMVLEKLLGRNDGTRVAVLSDFYLGGEDLRELLWHHGIGDERVEVVSSADSGRSKHRDGELLVWARDRYRVEPGRHVHIGDNRHADVAMQTATGGTAVHLVHGARRFAGPGQLDPVTLGATAVELRADLDAASQLRCRRDGLRSRPEERVLRAAWRTALLPVGLVAAATEDAMARGLDRVHYLSREGLFLARIHDEIAPILWPDRSPDGVHLAVSRRSTFGPSLTDRSTESLLDLWRMYPHQSPRALLVSLGVDPEGFAPDLRRFDLTLDETIEGIHLDRRIEAFLTDGDIDDRIDRLNRTRRAALLDYLAGRTDLDLDRMVVVDVGWRGTVQDNLARLLPDTHLVGWYLALFPFLNPQPANGEKHAIGPDGNRGQEFAFMEPPAAVERPWTPAAPSVVDYHRGPDGVEPVLDEEVLDRAGRAAIARYQDAVVEAAPSVARWIVANGAATDVLRPLVEEALTSYYGRPEPGIADLWFDSAHDDTFGALNVTSFAKTRPSREWLGDGLGPGFLRHLEAAAADSLWPAGYRHWQPVQAIASVERALRGNGFRAER